MSKTLTYIGNVSPTGDIKLPKRLRAEVSKAFAGKDIQAKFTVWQPIRSTAANNYYWGVILVYACQGFQDAGNDVHPDNPQDIEAMHDFFKRRFLKPKQMHDANGEVHDIGEYTTTDLTKPEFHEYIEKIRRFCIEFLNTYTPEPGEQVQLWG